MFPACQLYLNKAVLKYINIGSPTHSNQTRTKRHPNWKGGSKIVIICRLHDILHRKPYRLHKGTTWPNKQIEQSSGIQSQYSEINGIFIPIMNYHTEKLTKQSHLLLQQKEITKYQGINLTKD